MKIYETSMNFDDNTLELTFEKISKNCSLKFTSKQKNELAFLVSRGQKVSIEREEILLGRTF